MTENGETGRGALDEWQELMHLIDLAAQRPSRARFTEVGQQAVRWKEAQRLLPRDTTSFSGSETPIYNDVVAETVARDHLGRQIEPGADGGYTVEATPDEELLVDGNDQE